jgi:putative flippase GtrA
VSDVPREGARLALRYGLFALCAAGVNLIVQWGIFSVVAGSLRSLAALAGGTAAGLLLKYVLDARWIFHAPIAAAPRELGRFVLYGVTGVVTTAVFWAVELAFIKAFAFPFSAYVGGALGLAAGYSLKYRLDARFVFAGRPGEGERNAGTSG